MSHVAKIEMQILNLDALAAAAKQLGLEFVKGQKTYKWFGKHVGDYPLPAGFKKEDLGFCEHAMRVKGNANAYEIGVMKRKDGKPGYTMLWDFWQGGYGLQEKVGKNGDRLKQEYAVQVAMRDRMRQGYRVQRIQEEDGTVTLRATK